MPSSYVDRFLRWPFAVAPCVQGNLAEGSNFLFSDSRTTSLSSGPADCRPEELAAQVEHIYSITWSARSSNVCGIVRPSAFAVLRLISSSNFVGCSIGRSPGLAPLRIRSTYDAARRW